MPQGDVAISVSVDQVHAVAGLIQPGDKVDILLDLNGNQETYLYQQVPVLAVGTTLVPAPGTAPSGPQTTATTTSNVITFAVTPAAAARIALADSNGGGVTGGIYLALEAAGNPAAAPTTITSSNLIPGNSTWGRHVGHDADHDADRRTHSTTAEDRNVFGSPATRHGRRTQCNTP